MRLRQADRRACQLYTTGSLPSLLYGNKVHGTSGKVLHNLRKESGKLHGYCGKGRFWTQNLQVSAHERRWPRLPRHSRTVHVWQHYTTAKPPSSKWPPHALCKRRQRSAMRLTE